MGLHGQAAVTHNQSPAAQAAPAPQDLMLSPEQLQLVTDYFQKVCKLHPAVHPLLHMACEVWPESVHCNGSCEGSGVAVPSVISQLSLQQDHQIESAGFSE